MKASELCYHCLLVFLYACYEPYVYASCFGSYLIKKELIVTPKEVLGQGHAGHQVGKEAARIPEMYQGTTSDDVDLGQHNFGIRDCQFLDSKQKTLTKNINNAHILGNTYFPYEYGRGRVFWR